jgi:hypothetical protein
MTCDDIHIEFCNASIKVAREAIAKIRHLDPNSIESLQANYTETLYRYEIMRWENVIANKQNKATDHTTGGGDLKIEIVNPNQ